MRPAEELYGQFKKIQGLLEQTQHLGIKAKDDPSLLASGAEFILEGLSALKRISRNEELGYHVEQQRAESQTGGTQSAGASAALAELRQWSVSWSVVVGRPVVGSGPFIG